MASTHQVGRLLYSRLVSKQLRRRVRRIKSDGLKNWGEGKTSDKKGVEIIRFKKAKRRIRTDLVTNTSPGILARQCKVWLQNTFGNNFRCNHALSSLWSKKEIVDNYLQQFRVKPTSLAKLGGV